jgi:hypothetical protein
MRGNAMCCLLLGTGLMVLGCRTTTSLDAVLADQRGTEKWTRASAAFKKIMRNYVHGGNESLSDQELDQAFTQYITLSKQDVRSFIDEQSCLPEPGTGEARYYMVNVAHQRHDAFYAPNQQRPITGTGTQSAHATFSANMLLERYAIDHSSSMPARASQQGAPFSKWEDISSAMTDQATFNAKFKLTDETQRQQIFALTSAMDWAQNVTGQLFMAPALAGGDVFSPALFAVYVFRADSSADYSVFLVVSANAAGKPQTPYVGLIKSERQDYNSVTGFAFTYLSSANNLLNYSLVMTGADPVMFELWITTAYPEHPDKPYLTVRSSFLPAVSAAMIASYKDVPGVKLIMMIRKGALMRDLIATYYPNSSDAQLWQDVGALRDDQKFKDQLAAVGLDVAADLFESDLWLEKPEVAPGRPDTYEARPGMELKCAAKRATK